MKYAVVLSIFVLSACAHGPVGNNAVPEPVKKVEVTPYLGTWYELARYDNRFEKGCEAVTANYSMREDGFISVINRCRKGGVDGVLDEAEGKARVVEGSNGAKLEVSFFWPLYGDYWVLDRAEDYSWSIVGEPSGRYLWILTRAAVPDDATRNMLVERARQLGYDTSLLYYPKHKS